ncbi:MAG: WecB/TagA/CpsF family glycosyltransferase [Chloroflexi bacterium]|nr:WecB/TagA/CpsF family glycosyltransferase [Chloroflexota bacterium]
MWISTHMAKTGARVVVGVGGSFDLISGRIRRAPRLVRRIGMEWLYRLVREPWRWRRQRVLPRFALLALHQALRQRLGAGRAIQ